MMVLLPAGSLPEAPLPPRQDAQLCAVRSRHDIESSTDRRKRPLHTSVTVRKSID
jgi:hypothetical protein